jgi:hypothetical protein
MKIMFWLFEGPTKEMIRVGWYGAWGEDAEETWRLMIKEYELQLLVESLLTLETQKGAVETTSSS